SAGIISTEVLFDRDGRHVAPAFWRVAPRPRSGRGFAQDRPPRLIVGHHLRHAGDEADRHAQLPGMVVRAEMIVDQPASTSPFDPSRTNKDWMGMAALHPSRPLKQCWWPLGSGHWVGDKGAIPFVECRGGGIPSSVTQANAANFSLRRPTSLHAATPGMTSSLNRRTLRRSRDRLSRSMRNPQIITPTPASAKARILRVTVSGLPVIMSSGLRAIAPLGFLPKKASASDL